MIGAQTIDSRVELRFGNDTPRSDRLECPSDCFGLHGQAA